jgi:hypothetical protein
MHLTRSLICSIIFSALSMPVIAGSSAHHQDPPIVREFQEHPTGYTLIGIGSVLSFFGFGGLFAGGKNPDYYCEKEKNKRTGESDDECRKRVSEQNAKFYRSMASVLGAGILISGTGGGLILWKNSRSSYSDNVTFNISDKSPKIVFTADLP